MKLRSSLTFPAVDIFDAVRFLHGARQIRAAQFSTQLR